LLSYVLIFVVPAFSKFAKISVLSLEVTII
jgi:hypothetical protein